MYGGIFRHYDALPRPTKRVGQALLTALVVAASGVLAATGTAAATAAPPTLYVSSGGSDSASGSAAAPLRTIGAAIRRTPDHGRVVVGSGTYHESIALQGHTGRSVVAAPGATVWLDGSRPVTTWSPSGSAWVSSGWTPRFDASPTFTKGAPDNTTSSWRFINPQYPMAAHPDQVFVDGRAQQQVASRDQLRAGAFYVDENAQQLWLGSDPTGHDVRASDLAKAITIQDPDTTISGINVRHYATSVPMMGTVTIERPGITVQNLRIEDNAATGLGIYGTDALVSKVQAWHNGMHGMTAGRAHGLRLLGVSVVGNNTEHFNYAPSAGGVKITRTHDVEIRGSLFAQNFGTGLWLDESVYGFSVVASRSSGNARHGIAAEISGKGRVIGNVVDGNLEDGLKVTDTDNVAIWNNTFTGNGRSIDIAQDARDQDAGRSYRDTTVPLSFRSRHIYVRNNILAKQRTSANCMLCVEDHSHRFSARQLDIHADGNLYQRPTINAPRWLVVWSRGPGNPAVFTTLAATRSTGQETRGRLVQTTVLTAARTQTGTVAKARTSTALPLPRWAAAEVGSRTGTRSLGAWRR